MPVLRPSLVIDIVHEEVGEPHGEAIDDHERAGRCVGDGARQLEWYFCRRPRRWSLSPVAGHAGAEIVVEGLSGGDEVNGPTVVLTHLHGECALAAARTADEEGERHQ